MKHSGIHKILPGFLIITLTLPGLAGAGTFDPLKTGQPAHLSLPNSSVSLNAEISQVSTHTGSTRGKSLMVKPQYDQERLIVRYKTDPRMTDSSLHRVMNRTNQRMGGSVVTDFSPVGIPGMQVIRPGNGTVEEAASVYANNSEVLYAEPDHLIALSPSEKPESVNVSSSGTPTGLIPNDPDFSLLWGLHNTGQSPFSGTAGADIDAPKAWSTTTGSSSVIVAVVDTGVDYTHKDLASNIWTNSGEIAGNGKDDDGNGYIDDVRGWNFCNNTNDPMDDNGHGTHCAGTIGAVGNNGIGVTGVNWKVKILPLKFLDSSGSGYTSNAISAILYANQIRAKVISCSWGGTEYSQALKDAIDASSAVVVCAAGNDGEDTDSSPLYPASYAGSNIISVAATDYNDKLASFSNYGEKSVDIAAPGVKIRSTYLTNQYAYLSGTSMATPHVSGVAALVQATDSSLSSSEVKARILNSADTLISLSGKMVSGGRLNATGAVRSASDSGMISPASGNTSSGDSGVSFTAAPRAGNAPLSVQFLDTSSGGETGWHWDFGDGITVNARNPRHTYQNAGSYTVTLKISDGEKSGMRTMAGFITVE